jgi:vesicular inhibitory amino acid transporter
MHAGKALVECADVVSKRRGLPAAAMGYEEIAEEAFGKLGRLIISSIIYVELFGTCCLLFILEVSHHQAAK